VLETPAVLPKRVCGEWIPVMVAMAALYGPTLYGLASTFWQSEDHAHGPIILAVVVWLAWRQRRAFASYPQQGGHTRAGVALVSVGLFAYVLGRPHEISVLEVGSLIPVSAGILVALRGTRSLRALWFPLLFMLFLVPLPAVFVDSLTGPLKQHVSDIAERVLYAAHYPVGRSGVVLTVGPYQMLVADACSGLNSMFSLTAIGLLYVHLQGRANWLHNMLVIASTLPIAFAANVVRVLVLVLITYHFGDDAGQGFLHGAAGIVLVLVAVALLLALDGLLARFATRWGAVTS
jgi:exosortase B